MENPSTVFGTQGQVRAGGWSSFMFIRTAGDPAREKMPPAVLNTSCCYCTDSELREGFSSELLSSFFHLPSEFLASASFLLAETLKGSWSSLQPRSFILSFYVSHSLPLALLSEPLPFSLLFPIGPGLFLFSGSSLLCAWPCAGSPVLDPAMPQALLPFISQPLLFSLTFLSALLSPGSFCCCYP